MNLSFLSFIVFIATIGLALGLTPLVGELYARGDRRHSAAYFQNGIAFYTLLGFVAMAVQLAAVPLMSRMGQPADVVEQAIPYYRMLAYSMPCVMLFFSFKQFLEGVGNTKAEMATTIVCNLANVGFNWLFIYGNLGFAAMGAAGAGLGTLLSRMLAPVLMIGYFYSRRRYRVYFDYFAWGNFSWGAVRALLRMGVPIAMQMFLESSAFVGTSIMTGWFDRVAVISAYQITMTLGNCAFMVVMSIGAATTIRVSHCYGARRIRELGAAARASFHLVVAWNLIAALCFIALRNIIPLWFTSNAEAIALASELLLYVALYQLMDGIQNVSVGILRGIQDVRILIPIALVSYWLFNLPVGYLLGFVCGMGAKGLVLGFTFGLTCAAVLLIARIRRSIDGLRRV